MIIVYWVDVFMVLSNLVFFLPAYEAFRLKRRLRALIYFFMCWASALYHTCLSFDVCLFDFYYHHLLDFFFAQFIIIVAGSYLIVFDDEYYRFLEYWALAIGAVGIVVLQILFPADLMIQAGIVGLVFVGIVAYWIIRAMQHKSPKYHWNMFTTGLALTAGSITLFIFQNSWYQLYWLIHSVWHIAAAFGQYYLLKIKEAPPVGYYVPAAKRVR